MAIQTSTVQSTPAWPIRVRAQKPHADRSVRTIRIGLLGLGQVGQAVARLAADRASCADAGLKFHVEQAFVRDLSKPRQCPKVPRLTSDAASFLRGRYDVVIEALDAAEPARTLVSRLLGRGVAVVTANKTLVAQHGSHLAATAADRGVAFRYEATALAAVPFLGTLAARPLVASVNRFTAIVNGTTNYVLSSLGESGTSFAEALHRARLLGYAEPDASRDVDGLDAADKLVLLTALFGWGRVLREPLDVTGIRDVTADDLAAARSLGGTVKAIAFAERDASGVRACVGPAFVPLSEPLASLGSALNGIRLDGRHVRDLFFSGPGAGPDVTAATLLDDAVQAVGTRTVDARAARSTHPVFPSSPVTPWFVRVTVPGVLPSVSALASLVAGAGLPVERAIDHAAGHSRWLLVGPAGRRDVDAAITRLSDTHRIAAVAFRRV